MGMVHSTKLLKCFAFETKTKKRVKNLWNRPKWVSNELSLITDKSWESWLLAMLHQRSCVIMKNIFLNFSNSIWFFLQNWSNLFQSFTAFSFFFYRIWIFAIQIHWSFEHSPSCPAPQKFTHPLFSLWQPNWKQRFISNKLWSVHLLDWDEIILSKGF